MLRILDVVMVLLALSAPAWTQVPRDEKEARERWAVCRSDADVDAAIQACTDSLAMSPVVRKWREYEYGYEKAKVTSTTSMTADTLGGIHQRRGALYEQKGEIDLAIADYRRATSYLPGDAQAFMLLGNAYIRRQNADGAIEAYGEAIKLDPKLTLAFVGRSGAFLVKRDMAHAQEDMNRAAALDPQLIEKFETNAKNDEVRALLHNARVASSAPAAPDCDEFCRTFQAMLNARGKGFQGIVGGDPNPLGASPAKVKLPGADKCEVTRKREFTCSFPPLEKEKARERFNELAKQVERALPAGWDKAEQAANWLCIFKHHGEQEAPIAITFTPDFFSSNFVVDITVKGL